MHFGRIDTTPPSDLSIPSDAPRTQAFLDLKWQGAGTIHAGCPIWNVKDWVGNFYPAETKPEAFLKEYAARLGAVEVSSTFYHQVAPDQIRQWAARVEPGFKFCPKVYRGISEQLGAPNLNDMIRRTVDGFAAFGDSYGLGFIQFAETLPHSQAARVQNFLKLWPTNLPLAVEFRHPSWYAGSALKDDVVNMLYRARAATVITDTPGRRDVLHTSLTQPRVIVRFLGSEGHASDASRADAWAERLTGWAARNLEDLYFFAHQPTEVLIPQTVNHFLRGLQRRGFLEPSPWRAPKPPRAPLDQLFDA